MSKEQLYHYNDTIDQLQQENERLKKEVNDWKQRFESSEKRLNQNMVNSVNVLSYKQNKIEELNQQLSEKNKELAELKQWKEELENNYHFQILAEQNQRIKELEKELEESFSQEDVEGLIKDRDITIKSLKEQLAEKEQELADWKDGAMIDKYEKQLAKFEEFRELMRLTDKRRDKQLRHKICETIRNEINEISFWDCESDCKMIEKDEFDKILNQIEQGDK